MPIAQRAELAANDCSAQSKKNSGDLHGFQWLCERVDVMSLGILSVRDRGSAQRHIYPEIQGLGFARSTK